MPHEHVEAATLRLLKKGGQGVLVEGGFILTASHCIEWSADGGMVLGDYYIEDIETADGTALKASPLVVELMADVAVLGQVDAENFYEEAHALRDFCEKTKRVKICRDEFEIERPFRIHVRTHIGTWITGTAQLMAEESLQIYVEADSQIEEGTSGGPIVNDDGELIAIASVVSFNADHGPCYGLQPRPMLTLPVWVVNAINANE